MATPRVDTTTKHGTQIIWCVTVLAGLTLLCMTYLVGVHNKAVTEVVALGTVVLGIATGLIGLLGNLRQNGESLEAQVKVAEMNSSFHDTGLDVK